MKYATVRSIIASCRALWAPPPAAPLSRWHEVAPGVLIRELTDAELGDYPKPARPEPEPFDRGFLRPGRRR